VRRFCENGVAALRVRQAAGNHGSGPRHRPSSERNSLSEITIGSRWRRQHLPLRANPRCTRAARHDMMTDKILSALAYWRSYTRAAFLSCYTRLMTAARDCISDGTSLRL